MPILDDLKKSPASQPANPRKPATADDLADPYSFQLPPSVWSITGQSKTVKNPAAKDPAIKIIREHPLIVNNVLDEEVVIPWQTKQRHLYSGKDELTRERIIEISKSSDWNEKKVSQFNFKSPVY